ncbi:MAG TPA: hypothetical protein VFZ58_02735 [Candidatus Saccharimonadales bacterium]
MKRSLRAVIVAGLITTGMAASFWIVTAYAAEATLEQQQAIVTRCDQLRVQLGTVQKNETVTRVTRGRVYDLEIIPYVTAFNSRIATNNVDAPELISTAAQIQASVNAYANQFTTYSDDLTNAQRIDCKTKPGEFYDWLDKARADRATLAAQVAHIDQLVAAYTGQLQVLEQRFTPVINGSQQ